ncbi:hypothetical protein ACHAXS_010723, partial [Conticribra weissflogii]
MLELTCRFQVNYEREHQVFRKTETTEYVATTCKIRSSKTLLSFHIKDEQKTP